MNDPLQQERTPWLALAAVVLLGGFLRLWGIDFGLPNIYCRPDETTLVHRALSIASGDLNPHFFNYPSLQFYLLAIVYGVYFAVGYMAGLFSSVADFERLYFFDPSSFFLLGRLLTALMGTACIAVVYGIGRQLQNSRTGLLAAFFIACSFLHVRDSHFLTVDIPGLLQALLSIFFALRFARFHSTGPLVAAGIFLGLAASTKYNLGLLAPSIIWLLLVNSPKSIEYKHLLLLGGAAIISFLGASPYIALDFSTFWRDLSFERAHFSAGHGVDLGVGWVYHACFSLPLALGWPLFVFALLGLVGWVWRGGNMARALLVGFLCYYGIAGSGKLVFMRYVLPVIPLLCLAAAALLEQFARRFLPRGIVWLAACSLVVPTAHASWQHSRILAQTDTRVLAAEWVETHVEAGAKIAVCGVSDYDFIRLRKTSRQLQYMLRQQRQAGLSARRLEREIAYINGDARPRYEIVELLLDDLSQSNPCSVAALSEEGVSWLVVHERNRRMGVGTSIFPLEAELIGAKLVRQFNPFVDSEPAAPIYDAIDAFYVPVAGFDAITRPGPRIGIYSLRLE